MKVLATVIPHITNQCNGGEGSGHGSAVRSTCSFRGLGFGSQYPRGGSQPGETPLPGDPMSSFGLCEYTRCTRDLIV